MGFVVVVEVEGVGWMDDRMDCQGRRGRNDMVCRFHLVGVRSPGLSLLLWLLEVTMVVVVVVAGC